MDKKVFKDAKGRKVRTGHMKDNGVLEYVNNYFYRGDDKIPLGGLQTHYFDDGKVAIEREFLYSKHMKSLVFTKERIFDETGNMTEESFFDERTGEKIKEKIFKRNKDGYLFAHRRTFEPDGSTIKTDDICVALAGTLIPVDAPELKDFLSKLDNPFKKEIDPKARFLTQTKTR